jgi:dienelactone hydrolase
MMQIRAAVCGWALLCTLSAAAQTEATQAPVEIVMAQDLREEIQRLPVTVKDLNGRQETRQIPVTIFRPQGNGPFPLVIMNHGRAVSEKRAQQGRQRYENLARYLVGKGFVVLVPTRVGYGETYGDFDPESAGSCNALRLEPMTLAASDQVLATLAWARTLPYVDARRWLVMGQSVGGLTTVATVTRNPPGLVGAINFAGGTGGDPDKRTGEPCAPQATERLWQDKASGAKVPMLWLYWANDKYWGDAIPKRWYSAWVSGGGVAEFHTLPAVGVDGHNGLNIDMDTWVPLVEKYLAQRGFGTPGLISRPPVTAFARVDEAGKVPVAKVIQDGLYRKFLEAKAPRAFAVGKTGSAGYATGDWAMGRALGFCQARRGDSCKLYAVDDQVVWTKD